MLCRSKKFGTRFVQGFSFLAKPGKKTQYFQICFDRLPAGCVVPYLSLERQGITNVVGPPTPPKSFMEARPMAMSFFPWTKVASIRRPSAAWMINLVDSVGWQFLVQCQSNHSSIDLYGHDLLQSMIEEESFHSLVCILPWSFPQIRVLVS